MLALQGVKIACFSGSAFLNPKMHTYVVVKERIFRSNYASAFVYKWMETFNFMQKYFYRRNNDSFIRNNHGK